MPDARHRTGIGGIADRIEARFDLVVDAEPPNPFVYWVVLGLLAAATVFAPALIAMAFLGSWTFDSDIKAAMIASLGVVLGAAAVGDGQASGSLTRRPERRDARHAAAGLGFFGFWIAVVLAATVLFISPLAVGGPFVASTVLYAGQLWFLAAFPDGRASIPRRLRIAAFVTGYLWLSKNSVQAGRHGYETRPGLSVPSPRADRAEEL